MKLTTESSIEVKKQWSHTSTSPIVFMALTVSTSVWQHPNVPGITLFVRNTKKYTNLSYISFSSHAQLHTSGSDCKGVGNNTRRNIVKAFSALPSHS